MDLPPSLPSFQHAPPPIQNLKCINPNCFSIPSLSLLPPNSLSFSCICSPQTQTISLKTYLSKLNSFKIEQCQFDITHVSPNIPALQYCTNCEMWLCNDCVSFHKTKLGLSKHKITNNSYSSFYCSIHPSNEIHSYCLDCKEHFCQLCITQHKEHSTQHLKEMINEMEYQNIKKEYDNVKLKFYEEIKKVKDAVIKEYELKIKEIKEAYEKCLEINDGIVAFINLVFQNYEDNKNNYFLILNVLNNTHFNKENLAFKYKTNVLSKQKHNNILNYFSNTFIITNNITNNIPKSIPNIIPNNFFNDDIILKPSINILKSFTNCNEAITLLPYNKIATGSPQCSIKIFSLIKDLNICILIILNAHLDIITYLSYFNDKLFSCSYDTSIKIWNIFNIESNFLKYNLIITLSAHSKWINKVIPLTKDRFATCSNDHSIKIWNSNSPFNLIVKLEKHSDNVNSIIQLRDKEMLISVSSKQDMTLRMWDLEKYNEVYVMYKVQGVYYNSLIELKNGFVAVGGMGVVYIVDVVKKEVVKCIIHKELEELCVDSLIEIENHLVCGCERGKIVYIDIESFCSVELKGILHKDDVSGLVCTKREDENGSDNVNKDNNVIISASFDGSIKVWKG